jgi:hypothetical protein
MKPFLVCFAAALLLMGVAQSVAVAVPPAHKQAVIYTQRGPSQDQYIQQAADECAVAVIQTAKAHGMTKEVASQLFNQCLIDSKVTI